MLTRIDRLFEQRATAGQPSRPGLWMAGVPLPHVHRFRYAGDDSFSAHSLYRCRCGVVKHSL